MDKIFEISSDGTKLVHCSNNVNDYQLNMSKIIIIENAAQEFGENDFQVSWSTSEFVKQHGACTIADFTDSISGVKTHGLFAEDSLICLMSYSTCDLPTEEMQKNFKTMRIGQLSTKKLVLYNPADFPTDFPLNYITVPLGVETIGEYNQEIKGETNVEIIPVSA